MSSPEIKTREDNNKHLINNEKGTAVKPIILPIGVKANIAVRHNYDRDVALTYTILEVKLDEELKLTKDYLVYRVVLKAVDSSGNTRELVIIYRIKDTVNPVNGQIEISYDGIKTVETSGIEVNTNSSAIYFKLSGGTDVTGVNNIVYEYKVIIDGVIPGNWETYGSNYELAYTAANDQTSKVQILYRTKDSVGNTSEELYSVLFRVDKRVPELLAEAQEDEVVEIEEGTIYQGDKEVRVTFIDDGEVVNVKGYKNNNLIMSYLMTIKTHL